MKWVVQQDILKSDIYSRQKLSENQRYNTVGVYTNEDDARLHYEKMLSNKNLDNIRCPIRMIEVPDSTILFSLSNTNMD